MNIPSCGWDDIRRPLLAPSILSANPLSIGESIRALEGEADWIHVDIMDGHFVPNLTYGPSLVNALRREFPSSFLDVHIMAEPAEAFLDLFIAERPDTLTIHVEAASHIHGALQKIRAAGIRPGVTLNPGTPLSAVEPVLHAVDLILVMAVNPGFGGQQFIPEVLEKVKNLVRLRAVHSYGYLIEIDGGVNEKIAKDLVLNGCDVLVAGNAVFGAANPAEAARRIKENFN